MADGRGNRKATRPPRDAGHECPGINAELTPGYLEEIGSAGQATADTDFELMAWDPLLGDAPASAPADVG